MNDEYATSSLNTRGVAINALRGHFAMPAALFPCRQVFARVFDRFPDSSSTVTRQVPSSQAISPDMATTILIGTKVAEYPGTVIRFSKPFANACLAADDSLRQAAASWHLQHGWTSPYPGLCLVGLETKAHLFRELFAHLEAVRRPAENRTPIFYLGVPDVEAAFEKAERRGGKRLIGPETKPGGLCVGHFK